MAVAFSPADGTMIIDVDEAATDVSATVNFATDMPGSTLADLVYSVDPPLPEQAEVSGEIDAGGETGSVTVQIPHLIGFVPILAIDYMLDGVPGTVTSWDDLPAEAEQVYSYRKAIASPAIYTLTIEVAEVGPTPGTASADFTIRIEPNYTVGRDALIAAVDARR